MIYMHQRIKHRPFTARVLGPYVNGSTFRLVVFEQGLRKSVTAATRDEAEHLKAEIERMLQDPSVQSTEEVLAEYLTDLQERGLKSRSVIQTEQQLRIFLPVEAPLAQFTPDVAQCLYDNARQQVSARGRPLAVATHQLRLKAAKTFFRWVVARGYLPQNPFQHVRPVGKMNVGKPQLSLDEARRLTRYLWPRATAGDEGATALLTQLLLGLRSSEVLRRQVRDLDDAGQVLIIPSGQTGNSRRRLVVDERLRPLLLRQIEGKTPDELLFGRGPGHRTDYLCRRLRLYCEEARVPVVCPHSLRGLHSTLALEAGATSAAVASALGHSSFAMTAKHYADPDRLHNARARRVVEALDAESSSRSEPTELLHRLRALPKEQLAEILRSLGEERPSSL